MSIGSAISGVVTGSDSASVDATHGAIESDIDPGNSSYWGAGDVMDNGGSALIGQAGQLANTNLTANFNSMDADTAGLQALGSKFAQAYKSGGPEAAAALAQAQAKVDQIGGGLGGQKAIGQAGAQASMGVGQVGAQEQQQNATGMTNSAAGAAYTQLQKMVLQAALGHANRQKNIAAGAIQSGVTNLQNSAEEALTSGAANAQTGTQGIQTGYDQTMTNADLGIAGAAASGLAGAASTSIQAFNADPVNDPTNAPGYGAQDVTNDVYDVGGANDPTLQAGAGDLGGGMPDVNPYGAAAPLPDASTWGEFPA